MKNNTRTSETHRYALDLIGLLELVNYLKFLRSIARELPGGITEIFRPELMSHCEDFTRLAKGAMKIDPNVTFKFVVDYGEGLEESLELRLDDFFRHALGEFVGISRQKYAAAEKEVSGVLAIFTMEVNADTPYDKLLESYKTTDNVIIAGIAETDRRADAQRAREAAERRAQEVRIFQAQRAELEKALATF